MAGMETTPRETLRDQLRILKKTRNAIVLAHNYQPDEVQDAADFTGDSLELSRLAARETARVLLFAGVRFMAESAKILSPEKTVLLPAPDAGCPMADTITAEDVRRLRAQHPDAAIVAYVNSTAEVKAEVDICCTSANAVQVVASLPQDEVVFLPDRNLGDWVARHTPKRIIPWAGCCCTHNDIQLETMEQALAAHPQAKLMVHPECRPEICQRADAVLSTSQMLKYARAEKAEAFIVGTEIGLLHRLRLENPAKTFHPLAQDMVCASMKLTSLAMLVRSLEEMRHPVEVPEEVRKRAVRALDAMLKLV